MATTSMWRRRQAPSKLSSAGRRSFAPETPWSTNSVTVGAPWHLCRRAERRTSGSRVDTSGRGLIGRGGVVNDDNGPPEEIEAPDAPKGRRRVVANARDDVVVPVGLTRRRCGAPVEQELHRRLTAIRARQLLGKLARCRILDFDGLSTA